MMPIRRPPPSGLFIVLTAILRRGPIVSDVFTVANTCPATARHVACRRLRYVVAVPANTDGRREASRPPAF